jgi:hypothetical protein
MAVVTVDTHLLHPRGPQFLRRRLTKLLAARCFTLWRWRAQSFSGFSGRGDSRAAAIAESDDLRWMH